MPTVVGAVAKHVFALRCSPRWMQCLCGLRILAAVHFVSGSASCLRAQTAGDTQTLAARTHLSDSLRLTLDSARARALSANPDLLAARLDIPVARGSLAQASLPIRFNPSLDLLTRGIGTEVGVTQEIEIAGQPQARRTAGRAGLARATAGVRDVARDLIGDVDRTFYRVVAAQRRSALARDVLALNERLLNVTQRQLDAGEISRLDFNLATVEAGRARARGVATQRELEEATSVLRRLLGLGPRVPIAAVLPFTSLGLQMSSAADSVSMREVSRTSLLSLNADSITALALQRRPDLAERNAAARQAAAEVSVARRETFPNLALRVSSQRSEGSGARVLRPGIGITIPLFNLNRGEIASRRVAARQATIAEAALSARVRSEIAQAVATYEASAKEVQILETTVLEPGRENRRLLEIAYREGKVGLPVLLLIRNQVIDAELDYWSAWLVEHEALSDLALASGETIVHFDPTLAPGVSRDRASERP